ncbi:MAG: FAD:protein FMN transferase [Gemmatimonadetes bacterium]|nr:FAD:protein FMN transferase [Gemmatimonadota bacterium]
MRIDPFLGRVTTRRDFVTLGVGLFAAAALPAALLRRTTLARRTFPLMGTIAELQVAHRDERYAEAAIDAAIAELQRVEAMMSRFLPTSDIGRANLGAASDGVTITAETAEVIRAALAWSEASNGRFDPAVGRVSEVWDVLNRHEPPPADAVRPLAKRGFWRQLDVSTFGGAPAIRFASDDLHLDLGAIAKGYGIDRATQLLRDRKIAHAIVTVGGDLYALGGSPEGGPWSVGIRDPHDLKGIVQTLEVEDRAVATSGDYERFFRFHGVRYHHLMDPETAAPRRTMYHSATVLASRAMDADGASTSVFGLPRIAAMAIARRHAHDVDVIPLA